MAREINLVPDIKDEMIKALKVRNYTFFACIMVALASIVVVLVFAVISTSQQSVVNGKKATLNALSSKINSYADISEYLTIKDQLGNLSSIANNKKLLSRTFGLLSALLPTNGDSITISELNVDLSASEPRISFDAQADALVSPFIDYNVLEAFKKSMEFMRYDYGDYVDKNGATIPAYCIIDSGADGATLVDPENGYYAFWLINGEGCNPSADDESNPSAAYGYETEQYNDETVVRIWRTPQYNTWYRSSKMNLDGKISGVPHFESKCTTYSGTNEGNDTPIWSHTNDTCKLVPKDLEGIKITSSSNGRNAAGSLVLRFSAIITLSPDVYSFNNHHLLAVGPSGRYNVTDSFVQIQNMFEQRARDCADDDAACSDATTGGN